MLSFFSISKLQKGFTFVMQSKLSKKQIRKLKQQTNHIDQSPDEQWISELNKILAKMANITGTKLPGHRIKVTQQIKTSLMKYIPLIKTNFSKFDHEYKDITLSKPWLDAFQSLDDNPQKSLVYLDLNQKEVSVIKDMIQVITPDEDEMTLDLYINNHVLSDPQTKNPTTTNICTHLFEQAELSKTKLRDQEMIWYYVSKIIDSASINTQQATISSSDLKYDYDSKTGIIQDVKSIKNLPRFEHIFNSLIDSLIKDQYITKQNETITIKNTTKMIAYLMACHMSTLIHFIDEQNLTAISFEQKDSSSDIIGLLTKKLFVHDYHLTDKNKRYKKQLNLMLTVLHDDQDQFTLIAKNELTTLKQKLNNEQQKRITTEMYTLDGQKVTQELVNKLTSQMKQSELTNQKYQVAFQEVQELKTDNLELQSQIQKQKQRFKSDVNTHLQTERQLNQEIKALTYTNNKLSTNFKQHLQHDEINKKSSSVKRIQHEKDQLQNEIDQLRKSNNDLRANLKQAHDVLRKSNQQKEIEISDKSITPTSNSSTIKWSDFQF